MLARFAILAAILFSGSRAESQDPKSAATHTSPDPHKCKRCSAAYDKALAYLQKNMGSISFPARMVYGWLLLADGRYPEQLQQVLRTATQWDTQRNGSQHAGNWFPALAGMLLAANQKFTPTDEGKQAIQKIVDEFVKTQEKTGGWFKWFEGAIADGSPCKGYPVKDLGILDAIIYGFLWSAKSFGCKVPDDMMQKADKCLLSITGGSGISYGTGQNGGDPTGARGAFALLGLTDANQTGHRIYKTYEKLLERCIPAMDKGHHVGAFHCLGQVLGCHLQGPGVYAKLTAAWLDKLIDKQEPDGGVYVGDDGDAGGEKGLLQGNYGSTAAFALMILLQDAKRLQPPPKGKSGQPKSDKSGSTATLTKTSDAKPTLGLRASEFAGSLEVAKVIEKGPSESAGVQPGDLIVEFKGKKIEKSADLRAELGRCSAGQKIDLVVLRGGERVKVEIKLGVLEKAEDKDAGDGERF